MVINLTPRQILLTDLRQALNQANALAAYARRLQGDYTLVDVEEALHQTLQAADSYERCWEQTVAPLFEQLGRELVDSGEMPLPEQAGATPLGYRTVGRVWYATQYPAGMVW